LIDDDISGATASLHLPVLPTNNIIHCCLLTK